jgi:anthranilate phosphoribosyltransferase
MFADALKLLGSRRAIVVHGHDGLDEISVCAPTRVSELKNGRIETYDLMPEQYLGESADPASIQGGDPETNADITRQVLSGEKGPCRNVVVLNAAAALVAADQAADIPAGIRQAECAIDSGAAAGKLEQLVEYTQTNG